MCLNICVYLISLAMFRCQPHSGAPLACSCNLWVVFFLKLFILLGWWFVFFNHLVVASYASTITLLFGEIKNVDAPGTWLRLHAGTYLRFCLVLTVYTTVLMTSLYAFLHHRSMRCRGGLCCADIVVYGNNVSEGGTARCVVHVKRLDARVALGGWQPRYEEDS
jgi:hypothetical protein